MMNFKKWLYVLIILAPGFCVFVCSYYALLGAFSVWDIYVMKKSDPCIEDHPSLVWLEDKIKYVYGCIS